jgi:hypothetical protein
VVSIARDTLMVLLDADDVVDAGYVRHLAAAPRGTTRR